MNHGTKVQVLADPNGDLTISNDDGSITIHANGDITIATLAPIELAGASLGKLDTDWGLGLNMDDVKKAFGAILRRRGKKS